MLNRKLVSTYVKSFLASFFPLQRYTGATWNAPKNGTAACKNII